MNETIVIVVLGNRLKTEDIHPELKGRVDTAISLYQKVQNLKKNTDIVLIMSGGISNKEVPISESEVMREYCITNKIPQNKIMKEDRSLDTIGNAFFTKEIIDSIKNVTCIYVVSSCYHMNRSKYIFNMCFGMEYTFNFEYCYPYNKINVNKKEESSFMLASDFFMDIGAGEIRAIEERLFTAHKLYSNNSIS